MARKATDQVTTIGIDIGKNSFHLIGLDGAGNIVLRRKLSRSGDQQPAQVLVPLLGDPTHATGWSPQGRLPKMTASGQPRKSHEPT